MNWKFLPAALAGALLVLSGCSTSRVDPASRTKPAGDSAEMTALRRENESLRQEQAQGQRQVDQLSKQLAADREEQRRFREMMSTNFDLLEQSVSATLAKSADKGGKGPTPPPSGPTGTASPIPGGKDPAQAAPAGSTQAGSPAASAGSHDAKAQAAKGPAAKPEAVKHEAAKPESRATVSGGKQPATAARGTAPGARSTKQGLPVAAAAMTAASAKSGAAPSGALMTADGKPYEDPDLTESANPRQLKPNRAAKPLYEKGFGLFGNRQYEQSILVYQNFLTRYPDDIYSDNAQFWIGEAYLRMDKLDEAEASYRKVLREYAHKGTLEGYKTPDAIYRIGQIYAKRNNEKLARYYLDHLARRFPDSSAGRKASHELGQDAPLTSQVAGGFSNGG